MRINPSRFIPLDYSTLGEITFKKDFGQIVGVHPNTVSKHNKIARLISPEYRQEDDLYKALTRYMFWLLWHVQWMHTKFPRNAEAAKQQLIKHRHLFTKSKFKWQQSQNPNYTINKLLKGVN